MTAEDLGTEQASQSMLMLFGWSLTGSDLTSLYEIRPAKTTPSPKPPVRALITSLWLLLSLRLVLTSSHWLQVKNVELVKELGPGRGQVTIIQELLDQVPDPAALVGHTARFPPDWCIFTVLDGH